VPGAAPWRRGVARGGTDISGRRDGSREQLDAPAPGARTATAIRRRPPVGAQPEGARLEPQRSGPAPRRSGSGRRFPRRRRTSRSTRLAIEALQIGVGARGDGATTMPGGEARPACAHAAASRPSTRPSTRQSRCAKLGRLARAASHPGPPAVSRRTVPRHGLPGPALPCCARGQPALRRQLPGQHRVRLDRHRTGCSPRSRTVLVRQGVRTLVAYRCSTRARSRWRAARRSPSAGTSRSPRPARSAPAWSWSSGRTSGRCGSRPDRWSRRPTPSCTQQGCGGSSCTTTAPAPRGAARAARARQGAR
jgi:hypothetical protein